MAGNNQEEDKGDGQGKETGCKSSFNTAMSNSGTQGSMAGLISVPTPLVGCPYCNGIFLVPDLMEDSPPNNIPFDYGGDLSFCSFGPSPSAAMPSVPMGFRAATEVQRERLDASQLEQNSILHAANNILFGSTPQIFEPERLAGPFSTSFQGYPERMTDFDSPFALSSAAIFRDYEHAVENPIIFYQILITLQTLQRRTFLIPEFWGAPVDLHRIFVEVTSRGGICKITKHGRLGEVCAALPQNIGDRNLYRIYFSMLYDCEAHLCNFPYEYHVDPSSSAGAHPETGVLGEQPSLVHMQTIFSCNGKQPHQSICKNPFQRLPGSSLPLPRIQDFAPPQRKLDTSSHQIPPQYFTDYPQKFTSSAVRGSFASWAPNEGQVQPVRPQREAQAVSSQQREASLGIDWIKRNPGVPIPSRKMQPIASSRLGPSTMPTPEQRTLESSLTLQAYLAAASRLGITMTPSLAQRSSSARLAPFRYLAYRANYTAAKQLNITPHVAAPISSAEQVALQKEVGAVATEAQAANITQEAANIFPYPDWSLHAIPGSALFPSAPDPSSYTTQVSAQTVSQTTHPLAEAQISVMQTTDSLPGEDQAYNPVQNKRKTTPGERIGSCNLPTTPSADKVTLGQQEAISEPPFNMKLNSDQKDNQMKAGKTTAGAKDNADNLGSKKRKGNRRQSRK